MMPKGHQGRGLEACADYWWQKQRSLVLVLPWTACFSPFLILPVYFMSLSLLYVVIFGFCVFLSTEYGQVGFFLCIRQFVTLARGKVECVDGWKSTGSGVPDCGP
ncbi:hypothetical protein HDV57DRAFT_500963 [Trichoderma longibrachiatum]